MLLMLTSVALSDYFELFFLQI